MIKKSLLLLPMLAWTACSAPASVPASLSSAMLPAGVVQLTPSIPGMGEHWANPADMPLGPIYGVQNGQVIFLEYMISQEDFAAGKSWTDMKNELKGKLPPIDHVDVEFESNGHEGYTVPHYDFHIYFVSHDTHLKY